MTDRARRSWLRLSRSLGFVPGVMVATFALLGFVLVEVDRNIDLNGVRLVFAGDAPAARTVLSVIAGSLITVAGLTFSITMVVLQLASSQFSPRILRTLFGDRVIQLTIGTYVGTFVYSILVLRSVGSFTDSGTVPRLSVTLASLFGIFAVVQLVIFLNHVSQMAQISHVTGAIARDTLARADALYPEAYGAAAAEDGNALLGEWRASEPVRILPARPGYVQRIDVGRLFRQSGAGVERVALLVAPGDFVSVETVIAEIWPRDADEDAVSAVRRSISVESERDLDEDVDFGLRQLADTALKAVSPGINDPMTAVTCISYMRAVLVRLTERETPAAVRRSEDGHTTAILRLRTYDEYLESLLQISRHAGGDAWVVGELLGALIACARIAGERGAPERARTAHAIGSTIAQQGAAEAGNERDRQRIASLMAELDGLPAASPGG